MENKEDSIWGKLDNTDMDTLFWDDSKPTEKRLDWLIENLTIDEKLTLLSSIGADIPRLGIRGTYLGGEAAHGVVERNDLDESGKPDITTSFPQPIGMSSTWDIEAIRKAGEIVGTEARVIYHRHPDGGLSRWAPTVDLERDPRWGRNEEGYGEDPVLTGAMASSYIKGMQGDDPRYLRCAATLKHFYANNTENGRGWKNSSIDSRNMYELSGRKYEAFDAWDRVRLRINDREVYIRDDNTAALAPGGKTGDTFVMEDWGYGSILFRSERTGRYLQSRQYHTDKAPESRGRLTADRNSALDWFVMEIFHLETEKDGATRLTNRFHVPVCVREDGSLYADINGVPADIHVDIVSDGIEQAVSAAKKAETVVLALGCNPMVNAKEEIDRASIALPLHEQRLLEAVRSASKRVIVVMLSNYPYSMNGAEKDVDAMLWSASGSEEMGTALADILFGKVSPSGRLNQTWYRSDDDLPDINDYDIIRGHRTYRYYDGEVIFPFGYGLSYTTFKWSDLDVTLADRTMINVTLIVANTGSFISDEVVEIYCRAPEGRVPRPSRQLIAFTRVKDLLPGEKRIVSLNVPTRELEYYDTISNSMILVEGNYRFFAGHSSADETLTVSLFVPGVQTGCRDLSKRYRADSYDDYENVELLEGHFGFTSVSPRNITAPCTITFRDCHFKSIWKKCYILLKAEKRCEVNVLADGKCIATFRGDTGSYTEEAVFRENSLKEGDPQPDRWPAVYQEVELMCDTLPDKNEGTLTIEIKGDARICWFRFD